MNRKKLGTMFLAGALLLALAVSGGFAAALTTADFPLEGTRITTQSTTLGNLVADAVRDAANADLALVNASQMRAVSLAAGPIGEEQAASTLAYPDEAIAVMKLRGDTVRAMLERGLSLLPQPNKGFLQISGITARFDSRLNSGSRLVEVLVGGQALDPSREYRVALPLSLAKGAGGYFAVLNGFQYTQLDTTVRSALISYLSEHGAGSARAERPRLQDVSKS